MASSSSSQKPRRPSDIEIECRKEALKQIQEWSKGLITIQTAAVAALGFLLRFEAGSNARAASIWALIFLIASLVYGSFFLWTTIPTAIAKLPKVRQWDVYKHTGNYGTWTIQKMVTGQSILFLGSVVCFGLAVFLAEPKESKIEFKDEIKLHTPIELRGPLELKGPIELKGPLELKGPIEVKVKPDAGQAVLPPAK